LERFLLREKELGRGDLILPVYYVKAPVLEDQAKRAKDQLAQLIHGRNHIDWRHLRFKDLTSEQASLTLEKMALDIVAAMERSNDVSPPIAVIVPSAPVVEQSKPAWADAFGFSLPLPVGQDLSQHWLPACLEVHKPSRLGRSPSAGTMPLSFKMSIQNEINWRLQ
jgi:hypothetical protein